MACWRAMSRSTKGSRGGAAAMRPDVASLAIEEVKTTAALERLRPEWEVLWAATPFQSPAWLIPWWRHVGGGELLSLVVRDAGALVGLFPFYRYTQPTTG